MRPSTSILTSVIALAAIAVFAATAIAGDDENVTEKAITWEQLPTSVQKTIHKEAGDHPIAEIEEVTAGSVVSYAAEWFEGENEVEITVAADGKLLGREVEPRDDLEEGATPEEK